MQKIINFIQPTKKRILLLSWVRAQAGHFGDELADTLAEKTITDNKNSLFLPLPTTNLKYNLKIKLLTDWQDRWNSIDMGRYTHKSFPKENAKLILPHRNLQLFFSVHGYFNTFEYKINKTPSPLCVCGSFAFLVTPICVTEDMENMTPLFNYIRDC